MPLVYLAAGDWRGPACISQIVDIDFAPMQLGWVDAFNEIDDPWGPEIQQSYIHHTDLDIRNTLLNALHNKKGNDYSPVESYISILWFGG